METTDNAPRISLDGFSEWYRRNKLELLGQANDWKKENDKIVSDFLDTWPLERLKNLTLDEYVSGKGAESKSFCYEIEHGKYADMYLGIRGGSAGKFGIYWSKRHNAYCDQGNNVIAPDEVDEKFANLKKDLVDIITKGIHSEFDDVIFDKSNTTNSFFNRSAMTIKLLCAYSKGTLFSGINTNKDQKELWSKLVPLEKRGGVYKQNYEITTKISKRHEELSGGCLSIILWLYRNAVLSDEKSDSGLNKESDEGVMIVPNYKLNYSNMLQTSKNIILRGAPGTGKTYLANQIAADIVSNGRTTNVAELTSEEKEQVGFVQFHPSYDYTDFVEGLRPSTTAEGTVNFELKPGSFMAFVNKAKEIETDHGQDNFEEAWELFFEDVSEASINNEGFNGIKTLTGKPIKNLLVYNRNDMQGVYPAGKEMYWNHDQIYNVYRGLPGVKQGGLDNYRKAIVEYLKAHYGLKDYQAPMISETNDKNYVFIIDEINRGEISKIFGELFFSIDPEYRDYKEGVFTQYANLHDNPEEKFYIPSNVYIIGTMNDIDRSVDTFDFAMRRRFTFLEITAEESAENMGLSSSVKEQMARLNRSIVEKGGLTSDYQIGASYFKALEVPEEDDKNAPLWEHKLYPLLKDYFRGEYKSEDILEKIKKDYFNKED